MRFVRYAMFAGVVAFTSHVPFLAADSPIDWKPKKTWVFAVGLLQWEREDIWSSFPDCMKDRRDEQLVKFFRKAGVPEGQIVYLQDSKATKKHIQHAFVELLDQTDKGDLLVFYFAGHGYRDENSGQTWFANYDAADKNSSGWNVQGIFTTIENHFSGDSVLMLADCCHSGALYDNAKRIAKDSDLSYAVITSSYSHNLSTGNWTFSDCLLAGLRGEGAVDLDGDSTVDLQELARYAELELGFIEQQKSMFTTVNGYGKKSRLAVVHTPAVPRVGQRIQVSFKNKWYRAKTIAVNGPSVKVHYIGWDPKWDEWVGPERLRPYQPAQFGEGDKVDVYWDSDGKWYPATIAEAWYGLHRVRYDGYDESSDEWVGPKYIRLRTQ